VAFPIRKFKLTFLDGSTETVETVGLWLAWFKGKVRAAEKDTVLVKVEEVGRPSVRKIEDLSPLSVTIYFDLPTVDKALELETFLHMVSEGKARIHLVDRANWRVRVEAEFLEKVY